MSSSQTVSAWPIPFYKAAKMDKLFIRTIKTTTGNFTLRLEYIKMKVLSRQQDTTLKRGRTIQHTGAHCEKLNIPKSCNYFNLLYNIQW